MPPTTQGRHCAACEKPVVDFTTMSDDEVVAFFAQPANHGRCGRFRNDQLARTLRTQPPAPRPWATLVTAAATALAACSFPSPDTATQPPTVLHHAPADSAAAASVPAGALAVAEQPGTQPPHLKKVPVADIKVVEPLPAVVIPEYYGATMGIPAYTEPDSATAPLPDSTRIR